MENKKLDTVLYADEDNRTNLIYTTFGNFRLKYYEPIGDYKGSLVLEQWNEAAVDFRDVVLIRENNVQINKEFIDVKIIEL